MFKDHKVVLDTLLDHFSEQEKLDFIESIKYFGKTIEQMSSDI